MQDLIGALSTSMGLVSSIGKAMIGIRDAMAFNDKFLEFQEAMKSANNDLLALQEFHISQERRISSLEEENRQLKEFTANKEKYELREIGSGVFVYVDKNSMDVSDSTIKFCPTCFHQNMISVLQRAPDAPARRVQLSCTRCNASFLFNHYLHK